MSTSNAIQLNNAGADLLEVGLLEQAGNKFKASIEQMAELIMSEQADAWSTNAPTAGEIQYSQPITGWSKPCPIATATTAASTTGTRLLQVYNRAAYLNTSFSPYGVSTYTAVPLLNLAIINHLIGLRDHSPPHYERASQIYETVMESLDESQPHDNTNMLLLHLALYTNCGQILAKLHQNKRSALECFQAVVRIITWLNMRNSALLVLGGPEVEALISNMANMLETRHDDPSYMILEPGAAAA